MKLNVLQWLVAATALFLLAWHERRAPWPPHRIAGALLCLAGFALVSVARYQLGKSFSISAKAQSLVTTGIYARFRNPIYVFAEAFLLGLALFLSSWWPIVLLLAAIPIQVIRARKEPPSSRPPSEKSIAATGLKPGSNPARGTPHTTPLAPPGTYSCTPLVAA